MDNTKQLNGRTYSFGMMPPDVAVPMQLELGKLIGQPLLIAMMDYRKKQVEIDDEASEEQAMEQAGIAAIGKLLGSLSVKDTMAMLKTTFEYVSVDGKRVNFNSDFAGRTAEMWQVFISALRFNFSDFFTGSLLASFRDKIPASLKSSLSM